MNKNLKHFKGEKLMIYQSKKDPNVKVKILNKEEKYGTVLMEYISGEKKGTTTSITLATLHRWWTVVTDIMTRLNIDEEQVNTPYRPNVTPHYIEPPKAILEKEKAKKKVEPKVSKYNENLPCFAEVCRTFESITESVSDKSHYIRLKDDTTIWRKLSCIDIYTVENLWIRLTEEGLTSKPNKDKNRPFAFHLLAKEEWEKVKGVILENV